VGSHIALYGPEKGKEGVLRTRGKREIISSKEKGAHEFRNWTHR